MEPSVSPNNSKSGAPIWLKLLVVFSVTFFCLFLGGIIFLINAFASFSQNINLNISNQGVLNDTEVPENSTSAFSAFVFPKLESENVLDYMSQFESMYITECEKNGVETELCTCVYDRLLEDVGGPGLIDIAVGLLGKDPTDVNQLPPEILDAADQCLNK